jgi:hypothetical protein
MARACFEPAIDQKSWSDLTDELDRLATTTPCILLLFLFNECTVLPVEKGA